jgi:hypothetical protein
VKLNIKTLLRLSIFLLLTGSLLACVEQPVNISETVQYAVKADKKVNKLILKQTAFAQVRDQKMFVKLGGFAFTLPNNWRDTSRYIYKSKQQTIALTATFSETRKIITLEKLLSLRRQELSDTMGDELEFLSLEQGKVATLPAIQQRFSFGDQGKKYLEYQISAFYGENKYLTLSYVGPYENTSLQATFDHIIASAQLSSETQSEPIADHYVYRQANVLLLNIPKALQPPRYYTYVSQDGSLKLKASLYNPSDSWPDNSVEMHAAKDMRFAGTMGLSSKEHQNNVAVQKIDYIFQGGDPIDPSLYRAHRAQIDRSGERLILYLKGDVSHSQQIDDFWQPLMSDLIKNSSPLTPTKVDEASTSQIKSS